MLREFGLMLGSLPPAARKALAATWSSLTRGPGCTRRPGAGGSPGWTTGCAGAYIRALLARHDVAAEMIRRLKSVVTMCYYELPEVQREIGYSPAPYIAAVSRRRLESYGPQIPRPKQPRGRRQGTLGTSATLRRTSRDRAERADRAGTRSPATSSSSAER